MLCFELLDGGKKIQIYGDAAGLSQLIEKITSLLRNGDHVHLWGPSTGGNVLTETTPFGQAAAQEVIIDLEPDPQP